MLVDGGDGSCLSHAQPMLDLGEDLLDRVEVGRVRRQIGELCARSADGLANGLCPVTAEIVAHDDIAIGLPFRSTSHQPQQQCCLYRFHM